MGRPAAQLIGKKFGRWTVIARQESDSTKQVLWLCSCLCGKTGVRSSSHLTRGKTHSCGCAPKCITNRLTFAKSMEGKKFHRLLVVGRAPNKYVRAGARGVEATAMYECLCDCGNKIITSGHSVRRGDTKSCGHIQKENTFRHPRGVAGRNRILSTYKIGAKKRGLEWSLSDKEFDLLVTSFCHYCGAELLGKHGGAPTQRQNGVFKYNGIDRKDNSLGYTKENCLSCCKHCNRAKRAMSYEDFKSWLTRAALWIQRGNNHGRTTTAS